MYKTTPDFPRSPSRDAAACAPGPTQRTVCSQSNRRQFLRSGAVLGAAVALDRLPLCSADEQTQDAGPIGRHPPLDVVRMGVVGIGGRGAGLLRLLVQQEGVEIRAVGDLIKARVAGAQHIVEEAGQARPAGYSRGEYDFKRMCDEQDLDLLLTATPWRWHVPMCLAAMETGKHAATEVPAAVTIDECWQLVEHAEKYNRHCVMLENVCYGRPEMMMLNMTRKGVFGELIHGSAGYMHELREDRELISPDGSEVRWRLQQMIDHNANLYPTHGLGPIAQCMNIDRGDRFEYLVSMSSKSAGLNYYYGKTFGKDHPLATRKYALGDVNYSLIRTAKGRTIVLGHDTQLPRPYSRLTSLQGTKGIFQRFPDRIHIEGRSSFHSWDPLDGYWEEYDHPLWKQLGPKAGEKGHGGADFMELYRLIEALRTGTPPDQNVYDAASWSVPFPLSEQSVANNSRPVDFPDFTRGKWKTNPPLGIVTA